MRTLKTTFVISLMLYIIVYLIVSFCSWHFYNPIQWILNMPSYQSEERFCILFAWSLYWAILVGFTYQVLNDQDIKDKRIAVKFLKAERERMQWSKDTFTEATSLSSLEKAKGEINEMIQDITNGKKEPKEPADIIMCVFDSSGRHEMDVINVMEAYIEKVEINKARKWKKNPDNTYSHIKGPHPRPTE